MTPSRCLEYDFIFISGEAIKRTPNRQMVRTCSDPINEPKANDLSSSFNFLLFVKFMNMYSAPLSAAAMRTVSSIRPSHLPDASGVLDLCGLLLSRMG